jgi:DNA ligase (NAD+)
MSKISTTITRLRAADDAYYNGTAIMSDTEYDQLRASLKTLIAVSREEAALRKEYLSAVRTAAKAASGWKKAKLAGPMPSLDKALTLEDASVWEKRGQLDVSSGYCVMDKMDGLTCELLFEDGEFIRGVTGGDGITGDDITRNVKKMLIGQYGQPPRLVDPDTRAVIPGVVRARGEIILTFAKWQEHFSDMANPRNGAAGIAGREDGDGVEHLELWLYDLEGKAIIIPTHSVRMQLLKDMGFSVPSFTHCKDMNAVQKLYNEYPRKTRASLPYMIDGLVVRIEDNQVFEEAGYDRSGSAPKGAVAIKFPPEIVKATVTRIVWQVGQHGRLSPVAEVEPVKFVESGVTVVRASVSNMDKMRTLQVGVGSVVKLARQGDVIPDVIEVVLNPVATVAVPTACPCCKGAVEERDLYPFCTNDDCPGLQLATFVNYIRKVKESDATKKAFMGWGPAVVQAMLSSGRLRTFTDLYTVTAEELASLTKPNGAVFGRTSIKLVEARESARAMSLATLMGSIGIPLCARSTSEKIITALQDELPDRAALTTASDLLLLAGKTPEFEDKLATIPDIGDARAAAFVEGIRAFAKKPILEGLTDELEFTAPEAKRAPVEGPLQGMSVCFTGKASMPRKDLVKIAEAAGAEFIDGVSKGLTFLVSADINSASGKFKAAAKHGVTILLEEDFFRLAKGEVTLEDLKAELEGER